MADRNDVHVLIGSKHNKWSHNSNDDSWYAENITQGGASEDRASFHYPNMERWLLRATQRYERGESKYNPFSGKNLAFVLHDKETEGTATVMVSPNVMEYARKIFRTDKDFVVEMFDWDLETLSSEQLMAIFNDIHRSFVTCSFSDTLGIATPTTLVAQVKTPALPARGKTNKRRIKEGKNMKKNVVKLNESKLREMVAESLKRVLSEKTATMPDYFQSDIDDLQNTTYNLDDYPEHKNYKSYAEVLDDVDSHFRAIVTTFDYLEAPGDYLEISDNSTFEKYVNYIDKGVERLRMVVARMRDLAIMKMGGEPDKSLVKGLYRNY